MVTPSIHAVSRDGARFIFLLIAFCVVWNIYDNQRFVVTEQTVTLDDLPNSFDGYRILQISDLHGKYFGENQLDLLSAINQLDYSHILDDDRRKNAELFEEAFYEKKNLDPQMHVHQENNNAPVADEVDPELLAKVLANPEMRALLNSLAKTMK